LRRPLRGDMWKPLRQSFSVMTALSEVPRPPADAGPEASVGNLLCNTRLSWAPMLQEE
jgi:hypothetical protein